MGSQRIENDTLHFPKKTDIHCGNQIFWACDDVVIYHRPELLQIEKYGKVPFPVNSKGLIHCYWIKSRKNRTGHLWFKNEFHIGNMTQIDPITVKWVFDQMKIS